MESALQSERDMKEKSIEIVKSKRMMLKQMAAEDKDQEVEQFDKMKLIKENLFLLAELDKLKQSNHSLSQRVYYLESVTRVLPRKF